MKHKLERSRFFRISDQYYYSHKYVHKLVKNIHIEFSPGRAEVRLKIAEGYNENKAKQLFRKHPLWKQSKMKLSFDNIWITPLVFSLRNTPSSLESTAVLSKEIIDIILPILDNIEPLVRLQKCSQCKQYLDGTIQK